MSAASRDAYDDWQKELQECNDWQKELTRDPGYLDWLDTLNHKNKEEKENELNSEKKGRRLPASITGNTSRYLQRGH